jgi:hypothetical protein
MEIVARDLADDLSCVRIGQVSRSAFESTSTVGSVAGRLDVLPPPDERGD